jgi:hypothetical protein
MLGLEKPLMLVLIAVQLATVQPTRGTLEQQASRAMEKTP